MKKKKKNSKNIKKRNTERFEKSKSEKSKSEKSKSEKSKSVDIGDTIATRARGFDIKDMFTKSTEFVNEALLELKRMTYPARLEVVQITIIIFITVVILSLFLWVLDIFFSWIMRGFLGI